MLRCALLAAILLVIHLQQRKMRSEEHHGEPQRISLAELQRLFPTASAIAAGTQPNEAQAAVDDGGRHLGQVVQTSPTADHIVGYCGPTNVLIATRRDGRIAGIELLESYDTRDHVAKVRGDETFLNAFTGLTATEVASLESVDAVAGATLTSLAIHEAISLRLTGAARSLRFPASLEMGAVRGLFAAASRVMPDELHASWFRVLDANARQVGSILRTSPAADSVVGYQGPSDAFVGFNPQGRVVGAGLGASYDNEPYVTYVREDSYFNQLFNDLDVTALATLDLEEAGVEGVSGATMTSLAVAEGLRQAAGAVDGARHSRAGRRWFRAVSRRDVAISVVVVCGVVVCLTPLRGNRWAKWGLQVLVVGYLGIITGDMLSLALVGGWAQHGIAWRHGLGLVVLAAAALVVPAASRRNVYCSDLCPHGILQQWLHSISPWRVRLPSPAARLLAALPLLLLAMGIVVAMRPSAIDLVDLEAFDAWHLGIAGAAALTIAIVGLTAAVVSPMAYCRYGCPTGAILKTVRTHARSGEWTRRDWAAVGLLVLAVSLYVS